MHQTRLGWEGSTREGGQRLQVLLRALLCHRGAWPSQPRLGQPWCCAMGLEQASRSTQGGRQLPGPSWCLRCLQLGGTGVRPWRRVSPLPAGALGENRLAGPLAIKKKGKKCRHLPFGKELARRCWGELWKGYSPFAFYPSVISTLTGAIKRQAWRYEAISVERPEY